MRIYRSVVLLPVCLLAGILAPQARAGLVAAYTFTNTLHAEENGVPDLAVIDPLGVSGYQTMTVFGATRNTWRFDGATTPASQGGLVFDTTGLLSSPTNYSVEIVFSFTSGSGWRRILDSLDRTSDSGLYIDPSNDLDVYPNGGNSSPFSPNTFYDVFVTVDSSDTVTGYFSGLQQFTASSASLNILTNYLGFFIDNTQAGGQGEWSSGNVALIKVFDTALSAQQVAAETEDPFQGTGAPEPGSVALMLGGLALCYRRFRASSSSSVRGQSAPSSLESPRSASTLPPV